MIGTTMMTTRVVATDRRPSNLNVAFSAGATSLPAFVVFPER
jgi:hypothetical protein